MEVQQIDALPQEPVLKNIRQSKLLADDFRRDMRVAELVKERIPESPVKYQNGSYGIRIIIPDIPTEDRALIVLNAISEKMKTLSEYLRNMAKENLNKSMDALIQG